MALVRNVTLSFEPSDSIDVVGYNLYLEESPEVPTFDSQMWELGDVTTVDMSTLDGMTTKDGVYNIGVSAVDKAGNLSSMSMASDVPLDFDAPNPPGELVITQS